MKQNILSLSREELQEKITESRSVSDLICRFGLQPSNNNYNLIRQRTSELGLELPEYERNGRQNQRQRPITAYLSNENRVTSSHTFKKRLIKEGYFEHRCQSCELSEWLGGAIPLELHHKDGNRDNNTLNNLELLCPNCHSHTDNYRGKAKSKGEMICECGAKKSTSLKTTCKQCWAAKQVKEAPPKEELFERARQFQSMRKLSEFYGVARATIKKWLQEYDAILVDKMIVLKKELIDEFLKTMPEDGRRVSFVDVAEKYGVTDNGVRKWCRKFGLPDKSFDWIDFVIH